MTDIRKQFGDLPFEAKVNFLNACIALLSPDRSEIEPYQPSLPVATMIAEITNLFHRQSLLHAAQRALHETRNDSNSHKNVFFDLLEAFSLDQDASSPQKRALAASAWANGLAAGKHGESRSTNPYSPACPDLSHNWDQGWQESSQS